MRGVRKVMEGAWRQKCHPKTEYWFCLSNASNSGLKISNNTTDRLYCIAGYKRCEVTMKMEIDGAFRSQRRRLLRLVWLSRPLAAAMQATIAIVFYDEHR